MYIKTMGKSKELSENEMQILYGQTRFPLLNDRELADRLDFKMTTLTAIKNRLKKHDYLTKIRIPMFQKFGCELMDISYGDAFPKNPKTDMNKVLRESEKSNPRSFYITHGMNQHVIMRVFRHFTEAKLINDRFQRAYSRDRGFGGMGLKQELFPYQTIRKLNLFDHSDILKKAFEFGNFEEEMEQKPIIDINPQAIKLKKLEKKILYGLVKYPSLADSRVCKKIGTTRQAVARMRKKFESDGIIKTVKLANLAKLGYTIIVLFHLRMDTNGSSKYPGEWMNKIDEIMTPIFQVADDTQSVHISLFRDFEHFQGSKSELYSHMVREVSFTEPPIAIPFSITSESLFIKHDYSRAIKNILGI